MPVIRVVKEISYQGKRVKPDTVLSIPVISTARAFVALKKAEYVKRVDDTLAPPEPGETTKPKKRQAKSKDIIFEPEIPEAE